MNNMGRKRRRWHAWDKHIKRCRRLGLRKPSGGMRRYIRQRLASDARREARRFAEFGEVMFRLTGVDIGKHVPPPVVMVGDPRRRRQGHAMGEGCEPT